MIKNYKYFSILLIIFPIIKNNLIVIQQKNTLSMSFIFFKLTNIILSVRLWVNTPAFKASFFPFSNISFCKYILIFNITRSLYQISTVRFIIYLIYSKIMTLIFLIPTKVKIIFSFVKTHSTSWSIVKITYISCFFNRIC
jgi:hypothetical protein